MEEPVIYRKSEDFFITPTGIRMSRDATIYSPESIVMGGKNIVFEGVVIRGDLRKDKANTTSINMGRYTYLEKNVVIRPPFRLYKSDFLYLPIKVGDHVFIGEGTVVNAASISSNVQIGKNCVIVSSTPCSLHLFTGSFCGDKELC
ncbi:hypothetical protein DSO57_1005750 [Entomophthora muscae]|uniref:Uncharacterized protein n=1 Tax=Entomophthora muscae TaxID=34485 RepID=A0ACC2U5L7_9FUNG|nr:hypothetical protein DSO57_1005750 [Entomophthora muscae]